MFWGLRVFSRPLEMPAHAQPVSTSAGSPAAVARLFASAPGAPASAVAPPAASARFKLVGVMAPRSAGSGGVALISVDGQPPRAYRPGAVVTDDVVVQQLGQRSARLGAPQGGASFTLELPALPAAQTGNLPNANGVASPVTRMAPASPPGMPRPAAGPPQSAPASVPPPAQPPAQPEQAPEGAPPAEEPSHRRPS